MKIRESMAHLSPAKCAPQFSALSIDPTDYADPLFGVGSATSAGPAVPAGSIHPSPETLVKDCGGYTRNQPIIGFGHAYTSGAGGVKCYGNFLLSPTVDRLIPEHEERAAFAVSQTEIARSYEYSVTLDNGISCKVAPAHNSAIHRISYPRGHKGYLMLDVSHKLDLDTALLNGSVTVDPANKTVCGGGLYTGNWNGKEWNMFFCLTFDRDFSEIGTVRGESITAYTGAEKFTVSVTEQERLCAYVGFPEDVGEVSVKIAISFVSAEKAREFLALQIKDFDYAAVRDAARSKWRDVLGVIELITDDKKLLRRFYTALYHMNLQPTDRTSDHGTWDDFHTVWDTWKTVFPMYSLLYPDKMGSITDSFIKRYKHNLAENSGVVLGDEYMAAKESIAGQGGNDIDNAICDAYLKGIRLSEYDWEDAYELLLASAENMRSPEYVRIGYATKNAVTVSGLPYTWRFKPAAATLGFAFNDKAIAKVASELGTPEQRDKYEKRSANWLNVWNSELESEGFFGFPQNRNPDGSFDSGFDAHTGYNSHYYEATGWDASYFNYNDVSSLVKAMGGTDTFIRRLLWACDHSVNYFNDDHGKEGYLNFTNEPSFHIPWLFCTDEIRRPDLAAKVIDRVIERFSLDNDYPGDEDNGGMSSYYVFLMCGFFPYATTENYYLHGTRLERIAFRLGNGKEFTVTGENTGGGNIYVQSATWRGEPLNECKLTHAQILEGGEIHFVMGDSPSRWARA